MESSLKHYAIESTLGQGGMGVVYRARDTKLDRYVAVKVLSDAVAQDADRIAEREARLLASLKHPNIAALYGMEEEPGGARFLVMELVEGETLAARLKRGAIPVREAAQYAYQIAEALEAAHEKGIVHRDLKPGNVMITTAGQTKVLDFGLATIPQSTAVNSSAARSPSITAGETAAGLILGTPSYMSPEQADGLPADKRADIWSYGVVLWEMLTGQCLFDASTVSRAIADVLRKEIDFSAIPSETPAALKMLVRRCLDRDVRNRLRDIGEARIALSMPTTASDESASKPNPRSRWAWIAATVILAIGVGTIGIIHFREPPPEHRRFQFQITPPEEGRPIFKLSPDGRFLALLTSEGGTGGTRAIWLRSLEGLETRPLTSYPFVTRRQGFPLFWSANGKHIGFEAAGKLYKIARSGGPPVMLTDFPDFFGAAWLKDDVILVGSTNGLFRVPSSGGAPVKIYDGDAVLPAGLPNGKFLFSRRDGGIWGGSLDGAVPVQILAERTGEVQFVPAGVGSGLGQLLFKRGETLIAQSFDSVALKLHGEAIPVAERVGARSDFTASENGVLIYNRGTSNLRLLTWLDRSGRRLGSVGKPFDLNPNPAIRLSPDDSFAVVPVSGANGPDMWIMDLKREALSRFTFDGSASAIWAPDGRKVLWAARDGNRFLKSVDGSGGDELLFKAPDRGGYLYDWSQDGKAIAVTFSKSDSVIDRDIWLVRAEGDRKPFPYLQSRFQEYWAQISPDSRWMAYVSDQAGPLQVFVESIPAGKGRWQISTEGGDWPVWGRDGKELFFRQGTKIMAAPIRLTAAAVEAGTPQPLFDVPMDTRFQVSRDGQRFLIALPPQGDTTATVLTVDTDWRAGLPK